HQAVDFSKDLLGFSSSHTLEREEHDINELIRTTIDQVLPDLRTLQYADKVDLQLKLSKALIRCNIYRTPFMRIVRNIVINAYQAMEKQEQRRLVIRTYRDASRKIAHIEFIDTGHGIRKKDLRKLFRPDF